MGRVVVVILLAGAALGLFGTGPLSHVHTQAGPVTVEYERFVRHMGHSQFEVRVPAPPPGTSTVSVKITGGVARNMRMEDIQPQPATMRRTGGSTEFVFDATHSSDTLITFYYQPVEIGPRTGSIIVADAATVDVWQLTYP